jgi:uncharacterized membrane protein YcaP (DUF421 family)
MVSAFMLETPLWEIVARSTMVYFALAVVLRLMPKRQIGNLSPNDMIAVILIGTLAADGIMGEAKTITDLLLMVVVVLGLPLQPRRVLLAEPARYRPGLAHAAHP